MSKMSELDLDIRDYLEQGKSPVEIANLLEIPISWIYETSQEPVESNTEVFNPYDTVNS